MKIIFENSHFFGYFSTVFTDIDVYMDVGVLSEINSLCEELHIAVNML